MKKIALILALGLLSSGIAWAQAAWPGDTLRWGTHAEPELLWQLDAPASANQTGIGVRLGWGFQESLARTGYWGMDLGLFTLPRSATENTFQAWAGLSWSFPLTLGKLVRVSPGLGMGADVSMLPDPAPTSSPPPPVFSPGFRVEASIPVELYLGAFRYLRLIPALSLSSARNWSPVFSLGLGIRDENVALIREGVVKPALILEPHLFSPDGDKVADTMRLWLSAGNPRFVHDWRLEVFDPVGNSFRVWSGKGAPPENIVWDGRSESGELVAAAVDYPVVLSLHDRFGAVKTIQELALVDVLLEHQGDELRLTIPNIAFPASSSDLIKLAEGSFKEESRQVFRRLIQVFNTFPDYQIIIRSFVTLVNWQDPAAAAKEQTNELIPLSLQRAQALKQALVSLGIAEHRVAVQGMGAAEPLVAFGDTAQIWKNRRVEIILKKP